MGQCVGTSYKWIDSCTMASLRQWVWISISCGQSSGPRLKSIQTHGQWGMTWLGWSGTFGEKDWKIKGKEVWEGAVDGVSRSVKMLVSCYHSANNIHHRREIKQLRRQNDWASCC